MTPTTRHEEDQKLKLYVAEIVNNRDHKRRGDLIAFSEYLVSWLQDTFEAAELLVGKLTEGDAPKAVKDDLEVLRKVSEGALGLFVDALRNRHSMNEDQKDLVDVMLDDVAAREQTRFVLRLTQGWNKSSYRKAAAFTVDPSDADSFTSRQLIEFLTKFPRQSENSYEVVPLREVSDELYANDALMRQLRQLLGARDEASLHDVLTVLASEFRG